jgi:hypothetical protein
MTFTTFTTFTTVTYFLPQATRSTNGIRTQPSQRKALPPCLIGEVFSSEDQGQRTLCSKIYR